MPTSASLVVHSIRSLYFLHDLNGCFENSYTKPIIINMLIGPRRIFNFKRGITRKNTLMADIHPLKVKIIYVKVISYFAAKGSIPSIS